jgi:hypothetical protein
VTSDNDPKYPKTQGYPDQSIVDFFSPSNNSLFLSEKLKKIENHILEGRKKAKSVKKDKKLDRQIEVLLDDWHAYAYNRIHDEEAKKP